MNVVVKRREFELFFQEEEEKRSHILSQIRTCAKVELMKCTEDNKAF